MRSYMKYIRNVLIINYRRNLKAERLSLEVLKTIIAILYYKLK